MNSEVPQVLFHTASLSENFGKGKTFKVKKMSHKKAVPTLHFEILESTKKVEACIYFSLEKIFSL